jgi:hypothetical protein
MTETGLWGAGDGLPTQHTEPKAFEEEECLCNLEW